MSSALDTYEALFRAAQQDVRGHEKVAFTPGLRALGTQLSHWGNKARAGVSNALGKGVKTELKGTHGFGTATKDSLGEVDQLLKSKGQGLSPAQWEADNMAKMTPEQRWSWDTGNKIDFKPATPGAAKPMGSTNLKNLDNQQVRTQHYMDQAAKNSERAGKAHQRANAAEEAATKATESAEKAIRQSAGKISPGKALLGGAAAAGAVGAGSYYAGHQVAETEGKSNRNMAFGAGLAAGAAAPTVYQHATDAFQNLRGMMPGSGSGGGNVQQVHPSQGQQIQEQGQQAQETQQMDQNQGRQQSQQLLAQQQQQQALWEMLRQQQQQRYS